MSRLSFPSQSRKETRTCSSCNQEYQAEIHIVRIGSTDHEFGGRECPNCKLDREQEEAKAARQQELLEIAAQRQRWKERCGIPELFLGKTFENFEYKLQPKAFKMAEKFANSFPLDKSPRGFKSLLLYSVYPRFGVGKTHLTAAIAHRILDRWHGETRVCPVLFTTETELMLRIRATYNIKPEQLAWHEREEDIYSELKSRPLLLLDDVGKEQPTDNRFTQRVYFHIIDGRYQRELPIIITSNLDLEQLAGHIGDAATDRLIEMTAGQLVECKGDSYRRKVLLKQGTQ